MSKVNTSVFAALLLSASSLLASCGPEPAGEHTSPESTQGDYLGNDDLDTTEAATDTAGAAL